MTMFESRIEERLEWRKWVTPRPLSDRPIHNWYTFPHSFADDLLKGLADEWSLGPQDRILDPFVGAGTTILAAKELGIPASGYDLSPLATFVSSVKISEYDAEELKAGLDSLPDVCECSGLQGLSRVYPRFVQKALSERALESLDGLSVRIGEINVSEQIRDLLRLALLRTVGEFSRAVITGGWPRWADSGRDEQEIASTFRKHFTSMAVDAKHSDTPNDNRWKVDVADARSLPDRDGLYSAVVTSPPYPNRHDYTRVFGLELMFLFLDWDGTRQLRYQSLHSHPEARPVRPFTDGYCPPESLVDTVARIEATSIDPRITRMLLGYFVDIFLCLQEMHRVCRSGAWVAINVGNVQYRGVSVTVDEFVAEIAAQVGLECECIRVIRYRGNSAQQMSKHGRQPSRESIVFLSKPTSSE